MRAWMFLIAAALGSPAWAGEEAPGTDFEFSLHGDSFTLKVDEYYKPSVKLTDIAASMTTPKVMSDVSDSVDQVQIERSPDGSYLMKLRTVYAKVIKRILVTRCRETSNDVPEAPGLGPETKIQWTQDCQLDPSLGDTGKAFKSGSAVMTCSKQSAEYGAHCQVVVKGDMKPVSVSLLRFITLSKTPQDLALIAASSNLSDLAVLTRMVNDGLKPDQAKKAVDREGKLRKLISKFESLVNEGVASKTHERGLSVKGSTRTWEPR